MLTRDEFQTLYDQGPEATFALFEQQNATIAALQEQIVALQEQIGLLQAQVHELRGRLGKDSHNSNKPPSSDGLGKKPNATSQRPKTGRKPGGQPGHPGRTLTWSEQPDHQVVHTPVSCACCGLDLQATPATDGERRQVVELPALALQVTQHQVQQKVCPDCGHLNTGAFPQEAAQKLQYGPRVKALGLYFLDYHLLPYDRIGQIFADVFDASLSPGTLFRAQQDAADGLGQVMSCLRGCLINAAVIHCDETGLRVAGRLHWLHSAGTPTLTYYTVAPQRGHLGMDAAGVLPHFRGIAVHDGWSAYSRYGCAHALCNAHHLRELTALSEQEGQEWAKSLRSLLVEIKGAVETAVAQRRSRLSPLLEARFEARYRQYLAEGYAANPPPEPVTGKRGRPKQSQARNLLDRLQEGMSQTLRFMYDFRVPFDNNLAERDVRMVKVQQKVSGCFRTLSGAEAFCRVRSYLSTMRKQGRSVLSALEHVFLGRPFCPDIAG